MAKGKTSTALAILAMALVYVASGKLGLLLAIPPGYATAVWPPSGLALAAVLLYGRRVWPGVLLGSAFLNYNVALGSGADGSAAAALGISLAIGTGAALQAVYAGRLIRKTMPAAIDLLHDKDTLGFLLAAGPVGCLINASWSVGVLLLAGRLDQAHIVENWGTWWVGDTIGALIFTPLALLCVDTAAWKTARTRQLTVMVPMVLTFALVVLLFVCTSRWELELAPASRGMYSWAVLATGLFFTALLQALLLMVTGRTVVVERLVAERTSQLERATRLTVLGEMAAGVAHEINNPLMILKAQASVLKTQFASAQPDRARIEKGLANIDRFTARIADIVKALGRYSRDGERDPFVATPLAAVVLDTVGICEDTLRIKGIDLRLKLPPTDVMVECRASQIMQVLLNLLNNAEHALCGRRDQWIDVELVHDVTHATISVTDSGNGIPPDLQEKIFQPFFSTKSVGLGVGLGLSISARLMAEHQGSLSLDRSASHTRFELKLPLRQTGSVTQLPDASGKIG